MQIDNERITKAVLESGVGPLAMEDGAALVDAWAEKWHTDQQYTIVAVECGFSVQVDDLTWIVGMQDCIMSDAVGIFGNEWKTTKEPSRWWTEEKWLEDIKSGPQIATYALGQARGTFYERSEGDVRVFKLSVPYPVRERVRAVVKTAVPMFWPRQPEEDGWRTFDDAQLETVAQAYRVKAAMIRQARRMGLPWQLTGKHCVSFNRQCGWFDQCSELKYDLAHGAFDMDDPAGNAAVQFLPEEARTNPEAVILSSSAYSDYTRCMELGRRNAQGGKSDETLALDTGTVLHAGVAEFYRQMREQQNAASGPGLSE